MAGTTPKLQLPYPDLTEPADVPADVQALAERLDTILPAAGWIPITLQNGFTGTAHYLKDALGFVHMHGFISGGTPGAVAFTMPAGYRPTTPTGSTVFYAGTAGYTQVANNGNVTCAAATAWLDSVTYLAEQ